MGITFQACDHSTRQFLIICGLCIATIVVMTEAALASIIKGRVVDSAGQPVAGAEVRIWQKLPAADGQNIGNQSVMFDDGDALLTNDDGRFATPDILAGEAFARVVAEADGMLAGRSGWIEIGKDSTADASDIVLKRLHAVTGEVIDGQGQPVAGATVFNTGDGHQRVETKTARNGKFLLDGLPEGDVFLFAEKQGYRFTGMRLSAVDQATTLTLVTADEPVEPIITLPALVSDEDERALARKLVEAWLDETAKSGTDAARPLSALADLDPVEAYNRAGEMPFTQDRARNLSQLSILHKCVERRSLAWDELRTLFESVDDRSSRAGLYVLAAQKMDDTQSERRREWLDQALVSVRGIGEPARRAESLAFVARGLWDAGDSPRAAEIVSEAETIARQLPPHEGSRSAFIDLAVTQAKRDPDSALAWVERITDTSYAIDGGAVAIELLPEHAAAAQKLWRRTSDRLRNERPVQRFVRSAQIANFCYRMAGVASEQAERLARDEERQPLRVRGLGAVTMRLAEADPVAARSLLAEIVHDALVRAVDFDEFKPYWFLLSSPVTAAWTLPIAEKVDPQLGRECFWRSLALRPPRPRRDNLDDEVDEIDIELAMMLCRYDRNVARVLLAPHVARFPELTRCGSTSLDSRHARGVYAQASTETSKIIAAAMHIDARWSAELFDGLPRDATETERRFYAWVRTDFLSALSGHPDAPWGTPGRSSQFSANYWTPRGE